MSGSISIIEGINEHGVFDALVSGIQLNPQQGISQDDYATLQARVAALEVMIKSIFDEEEQT